MLRIILFFHPEQPKRPKQNVTYRLCSSLVQKLKSPAADCITSKKSSGRISHIKKVQEQNLPNQKSPKAEYQHGFNLVLCYHIGWTTSMPFAVIHPTYLRTNPWNFHEKILGINGAGKWHFFGFRLLSFF